MSFLTFVVVYGNCVKYERKALVRGSLRSFVRECNRAWLGRRARRNFGSCLSVCLFENVAHVSLSEARRSPFWRNLAAPFYSECCGIRCRLLSATRPYLRNICRTLPREKRHIIWRSYKLPPPWSIPRAYAI